MSRYLNPSIAIKDYSSYSMHIFGFIAFFFTFGLGIFALFKYLHTQHQELGLYIPYGIIIFMFNLFYLKAIRLSREDYEHKLQKEKEYSQSLLASQKRFLRYAVHETNTPLAVIMANIELYELEHGKNTTLHNIEAATKNIYGIYDDLSYLTKQDKVLYPKQAINLGDFIQSRIAFFDIVAKQSHVHFIFTHNTMQSILYINETKLQRIIDNNITNAIKYTQENEPIYVTLHASETNLVFEIKSHSTLIKDTGHVFDAYYREDGIQDGLGLGLNLVKSICREEDIRIALDSTVEMTSFTYYFKRQNYENIST